MRLQLLFFIDQNHLGPQNYNYNSVPGPFLKWFRIPGIFRLRKKPSGSADTTESALHVLRTLCTVQKNCTSQIFVYTCLVSQHKERPFLMNTTFLFFICKKSFFIIYDVQIIEVKLREGSTPQRQSIQHG